MNLRGEDASAALGGEKCALEAETRSLRARCEVAERQLAAIQHFLDTPLMGLTYMLRDGTIRHINGRGARNLNSEPAALLGRNMCDVLPSLAEQTHARIEQALDTRMPLHFETPVDLPTGRRWFRSTYYPVEATELEPEMVQLVSQDITELKQAEQALAAIEGRLSTVLEHAPHTIAILDRDATILYINRAPPGHSIGDIVGTSVAVQIAAADLSAFERAFEAAFQTAKLQILEVVGATGRIYESQLAPVVMDGEVRQVVTFAVDITERRAAEQRERELEAQMLHAQKLESLGVLAGGIAHDFNNLLVCVLGNAELTLRKPTPEVVAERVPDIVHAAQRAADLCRQMLAYAGRGRMRLEAVDMGSLSTDMLDLVRASISKRAIIRSECEARELAVEGDATQLGQVVMNLLTNASEALGGQDGEIVLRCGQTEWGGHGGEGEGLECPAAGAYVFVEVSDTGCGMDEATRRRMFDPFFTSKQQGSGLGLSAALGIVRRHRGGVIVDTEPGRGTTVRVLLPTSQQSAQPEVRKPAVMPAKNQTILVVDDETVVRNVLRAFLEGAGHGVLLASDGREALDVYDRDPARIDAVLTDLSMPRMDGLQVARALRERDPKLPIVLASGFGDESLRDLEPDGLPYFISKPFEMDALLAVLQEAIAGRS